MTREVLWDPSNAQFRANPYPFYHTLRTQSPVYRVPHGGPTVLTRYDDVVRLLRGADISRDIEAHQQIDETDPIAVHRRDRRTGAKTILNLDPPDHTRLRRLVSKAFTPTAIDQLRQPIIRMVDEVLDRAADRGSMELIDELAFPIPFAVISEMLVMPLDRSDELRTWSTALTLALEPNATLEELDAASASLQLLIPYLIEIIEDRRANPGTDLLSALLAVEDDGDTLSYEELISFVVLLYVAGHETTVNLIGNGMVALLRHRDELVRWRNDPLLDDIAVDELMRFDGPVQHTVRVPLVPLTFGDAAGNDEVIHPGTLVFAILGSANHDPSMFDQPDRLQIGRPNAQRHLGFSAGVHYCLGASLAKLEASVAISRLIRRFPDLELTGEPEWRDRITIRGVDRLELSLHA
ncbi:MAG TPA: cytochrome P450 [Ilumatobacter sp.]|nr:cytochrome P450 [Ilumatobacter sp.]